MNKSGGRVIWHCLVDIKAIRFVFRIGTYSLANEPLKYSNNIDPWNKDNYETYALPLSLAVLSDFIRPVIHLT